MFWSSRLIHVAAVAFAAAGLTSCGGGGDGPPPGRAIDRSGQSAGTITGFGSVFVNGVEWNTDTATFTIDDQPGSEANLQVGEFVIVSGSLDASGVTGSADAVERDTLARGQITSVDLATDSMIVLGQTVFIDANSIFAPPLIDLANIAVGATVEVDGLFTAGGNIVATLVKSAPAGSSNEVRGVVANYNGTTNRFTLGALAVDSTTAVFEDFGTGIANGNFVEVEGSMFDASGALIAVRVELEASSAVVGASEGSRFEVEGLITGFTNSSDFSVSGVRVTTNSGTTYENGSALDLALNVKVEVEGPVAANNMVVADEIEFKIESDVVIEARVEAVAATGDSFVMLGVDIAGTTTTQLIDESDLKLNNFTIADLTLGDYVKVKAVSGTAPLRASLVKRQNPEDKLKITGPVSAVNNPEFVIAGAVVRTDGATSFEDASGMSIAMTVFFAAVQSGARVGAEGQSPAEGILLAESVELK